MTLVSSKASCSSDSSSAGACSSLDLDVPVSDTRWLLFGGCSLHAFCVVFSAFSAFNCSSFRLDDRLVWTRFSSLAGATAASSSERRGLLGGGSTAGSTTLGLSAAAMFCACCCRALRAAKALTGAWRNQRQRSSLEPRWFNPYPQLALFQPCASWSLSKHKTLQFSPKPAALRRVESGRRDSPKKVNI